MTNETEAQLKRIADAIEGIAKLYKPQAAAPKPAANGEPVFPPYGRNKGGAIVGASIQDLEFYANGARRSLGDPSKERFHDKERALLGAIEAEMQRAYGITSSAQASTPPPDDSIPPPNDNDAPF